MFLKPIVVNVPHPEIVAGQALLDAAQNAVFLKAKQERKAFKAKTIKKVRLPDEVLYATDGTELQVKAFTKTTRKNH